MSRPPTQAERDKRQADTEGGYITLVAPPIPHMDVTIRFPGVLQCDEFRKRMPQPTDKFRVVSDIMYEGKVYLRMEVTGELMCSIVGGFAHNFDGEWVEHLSS